MGRDAVIASSALFLCGGCGLLLDLDTASRGEDAGTTAIDAGATRPADAGTADGSARGDGDMPDADDARDGSFSCLDVVEMLALDELTFDSTHTASQVTRCNSIAITTLGTPSMGTPDVVPASDGTTDRIVLRLAAVGGGSASLRLDFDRPVENLSFAFDWLSLNYDGVMFDERLGIRVDGLVVTPILARETDIVRHDDELGSTSVRGSGRVAIDRVSTLQIDLRNADVGDGWGIELHSFEFTTAP